jgi:hypothetical protein
MRTHTQALHAHSRRWDDVFDYSPADPPNFCLLQDSPPVLVDASLSAISGHCDSPVAPGGTVPPESAESAPLDGAAPLRQAAAGPGITAAWGGASLGHVAASADCGRRAKSEAATADFVVEEIEELSAGESGSGAPSPTLRVMPPPAAGLSGTGKQGGAATRRTRPASAKVWAR